MINELLEKKKRSQNGKNGEDRQVWTSRMSGICSALIVIKWI